MQRGRNEECQQVEGHGKTKGPRKKLIADHRGTRFILTYFTCAQALVLVLHHCGDKECFYSVVNDEDGKPVHGGSAGVRLRVYARVLGER